MTPVPSGIPWKRQFIKTYFKVDFILFSNKIWTWLKQRKIFLNFFDETVRLFWWFLRVPWNKNHFTYIISNICPLFQPLIFLLIGIHSMQGRTATTRHEVTGKEAQKRIQDTENLFRKNLQLKDVCWFWT